MLNANDLARCEGAFKWHTAQERDVSAMQYDSVYAWCSRETQKPKADWGNE